jgi:N-acetylglucosamine-6-phosphate deacetylase
MKAIVNANIIVGDEILTNHCILFNEKVIEIGKYDEIPIYQASEHIDAEGKFLSAGFIDIHIHGCAGADTMDEEPESLKKISQSIPSTGVTSFLPTTMTMHKNGIEQTLRNIRSAMQEHNGAEILGCHLEGPFINKSSRGAHDEVYIIEPDFSFIEPYCDIIKIVTLAPEICGSESFMESCKEHGIIVSIGHTQATYGESMAAVKKGAKLFTHTFNGMQPFHHRNPGAAGAALDSEIPCELIADNIHIHPAVQRILLKIKGVDRVILITDAMRACLMKDGTYNLGGQQVTVNNNEARLENEHLA